MNQQQTYSIQTKQVSTFNVNGVNCKLSRALTFNYVIGSSLWKQIVSAVHKSLLEADQFIIFFRPVLSVLDLNKQLPPGKSMNQNQSVYEVVVCSHVSPEIWTD